MSDIDQLTTEVRKLCARMEDHERRLFAMETDCKHCQGTVAGRLTHLEHAVDGNGQPGVVENLRTLTRHHEVMVGRIDTAVRLLRWLLGAVGSVGAAVVGLTLWLLERLI